MRTLASVPDVEHELDALYALPAGQFTAARNDLARRLLRAHQADRAAAVRTLRRPTAAAAAVNVLARREPRLRAQLVEATRRLEEARASALAGLATTTEVGDAARGEENAVRDLLAAAARNLTPRPGRALLERIGQTLRASAADEELRVLLERGRLTRDACPAGPLRDARTPLPSPRQALTGVHGELGRLQAKARALAAAARAAEVAADEAEREARRLRDSAREQRAAADEAMGRLGGP